MCGILMSWKFRGMPEWSKADEIKMFPSLWVEKNFQGKSWQESREEVLVISIIFSEVTMDPSPTSSSQKFASRTRKILTKFMEIFAVDLMQVFL
jgi:hypothetical protein